MKIISTKKFWYRFFLILGLLSIIDIVTRQINGLELGYVGLGIYLFFRFFIGDNALFVGIVKMILDFSLVWLLLAWLSRTKQAKQQEEPEA